MFDGLHIMLAMLIFDMCMFQRAGWSLETSAGIFFSAFLFYVDITSNHVLLDALITISFN